VVVAAGPPGGAVTEIAGLLAGGAALLLWPAPWSPATRRIRALRAPPSRVVTARGAGSSPATDRRRRWVLSAATGAATALLLGGPWGAAFGLAGAVLAERLLRRHAAGDRRELHAELVRELPGACDLLAVCSAAGVPVGAALSAVGAAVAPPLGPYLVATANLYRLGAEPRRAWTDVPVALEALGRVLVRAGESGAAVAPALRGLAADCRAEARAATDAGVRRAGVWILAPLGLCFLPAFVCLGVVPLVLGIAADVFG
jgi:Flp pilus assembly protein TadB